MEMTHEDVVMMRLVNQATAQALVVAQDYQTREILLFAPTGEVHRHPEAVPDGGDDVRALKASFRRP